MSPLESTVVDGATAQELSERLADVFRTADVGDVLPRTSSSMATLEEGAPAELSVGRVRAPDICRPVS